MSRVREVIYGLLKRSPEDELLNIEIAVVIGGAGKNPKSKAERITIREPSMSETHEQLELLITRVQELVQGNQESLQKIIQALGAVDVFGDKGASRQDKKEATSMLEGAADHIKKFLVVTNIAAEVLGNIIGKSADFVNHECSPTQVAKLIDAYIYVIGWETIKRVFLARMSTMKAAKAA